MLRDPELYKPEAPMGEIEAKTTKSLSITLYNQDGLKLYSSLPNTITSSQSVNKEMLFTNLYDFDQGLRSFTYKEPVFDDGEMVGVFEVNVAREKILSTISNRERKSTRLNSIHSSLSYPVFS